MDEVQKKLQDFSLKCICIEKNNLVYILTNDRKNIEKIKGKLQKQNLNTNFFKIIIVEKFIYNSNGKISYSLMKKNL